MVKYVPSGRELTAPEKEVVGILSEECNEVAIAVSKVNRFNLGDVNPTTGAANDVELALEVGDLKAMILVVERMGLVNLTYVRAGMGRKYDKLQEYMQNDVPPCVKQLDLLSSMDPLERVARKMALVWHGDELEWKGFRTKAEAWIALGEA